MELWDAYDKDLNLLPGMVLTRGEPIPEGVFHLVCDIIVRHTDGSYLLMQRDTRKHCGGLWEATAGGAALQGESPLLCAQRELQEETGIRAGYLAEIGRVRTHNTVYVEYFCETDCEKNSISLQEGETVAYRWVSRNELLCMDKSTLITERIQNFIEELRSENPGSSK